MRILDITKTNIELIFMGKELKLNLITQNKINAYWNMRKNKNPLLERNPVFCIENIKIEDSIVICLLQTDYAYYLYCVSKKQQLINKITNRFCFVVALIVTSDNKYIIGQMNKYTSSPRRFQLPGGGIENKDIAKGKVDINTNIQNEVREELNINISCYLNNMESKKPKYIVLGNCTVPIVYKVNIPLDSEYIDELYQKIPENNREFSRLFFLERTEDAIRNFIVKENNIADYLPIVLQTDIKYKR